MSDQSSRRTVLMLAGLFAAAAVLEGVMPAIAFAQGVSADAADEQNRDAIAHSSNFKAIYQDAELKAAFFLFMKNVYHLYPEDRFHKLLEEIAQAGQSDREIYRLAQSRIGSIKPFLSEARYALPALVKQKKEMARQTLDLLKVSRRIDGYMEVGTVGRYISKLRSSIRLSGDIVLLNVDAPTYSPSDIAERGQVSKLGRFVSLKDYSPVATADVADRSLDLVTNFIGFHHSPPEKRDAFVRSLHRALRPGGRLIVRDHDVDSDRMNRMVALAHDVFNMGLGIDWTVNQQEIRNFTSSAQLTAYLEGQGFKSNGRALLQPGDPTHNALMEFVRV
jgi:SAM-dependent methyltransferase